MRKFVKPQNIKGESFGFGILYESLQSHAKSKIYIETFAN